VVIIIVIKEQAQSKKARKEDASGVRVVSECLPFVRREAANREAVCDVWRRRLVPWKGVREVSEHMSINCHII
jgi:hypothetical protein